MCSAVFATIHTEGTRRLMNLFKEAGIGALVGKVAMNRNCPKTLQEPVREWVSGMEQLAAAFSDSDGLVIDDFGLYPDDYTLLQRLERFIYLGDDRHIAHRFCRGKEIKL